MLDVLSGVTIAAATFWALPAPLLPWPVLWLLLLPAMLMNLILSCCCWPGDESGVRSIIGLVVAVAVSLEVPSGIIWKDFVRCARWTSAIGEHTSILLGNQGSRGGGAVGTLSRECSFSRPFEEGVELPCYMLAYPEANSVAQAARIQSLEEENLILRERNRSEGDALDSLRRELRAKELQSKDLAASERLAQAELAKAAGAAQDLEDVVGAVREELRAANLSLLAEKEARSALAEKLHEQQRQLGEAETRALRASAAEQAAREQAAANDSARQLAQADAERARRDAQHAAESTAAAVREAGFVGERAQAELQSQLAAAQELARKQAAELVTLREKMSSSSVELDSRQERLDAANAMLERVQADKAAVTGQLSEAAHEVWESALQQRLRRMQSEALEQRLAHLQAECAAKDDRLRAAESEATELRSALRKQHARLAECEQTLQKVRVIEVPSLREDVRREESRAASAEAKLVAIEGQLASATLSLAESRQIAIDREQAVAHARSLQLAAELKLSDADQRVANEARRAALGGGRQRRLRAPRRADGRARRDARGAAASRGGVGGAEAEGAHA